MVDELAIKGKGIPNANNGNITLLKVCGGDIADRRRRRCHTLYSLFFYLLVFLVEVRVPWHGGIMGFGQKTSRDPQPFFFKGAYNAE